MNERLINGGKSLLLLRWMGGLETVFENSTRELDMHFLIEAIWYIVVRGTEIALWHHSCGRHLWLDLRPLFSWSRCFHWKGIWVLRTGWWVTLEIHTNLSWNLPENSVQLWLFSNLSTTRHFWETWWLYSRGCPCRKRWCSIRNVDLDFRPLCSYDISLSKWPTRTREKSFQVCYHLRMLWLTAHDPETLEWPLAVTNFREMQINQRKIRITWKIVGLDMRLVSSRWLSCHTQQIALLHSDLKDILHVGSSRYQGTPTCCPGDWALWEAGSPRMVPVLRPDIQAETHTLFFCLKTWGPQGKLFWECKAFLTVRHASLLMEKPVSAKRVSDWLLTGALPRNMKSGLAGLGRV